MPLLLPTEFGLYCAAGDFYIDPWRPVNRAVVTHAHTDHATWNCKSYLTSERGRGVLRERVGPDAIIETAPFARQLDINGVKISFHPAGHILGSAQVRVEYNGEVWVASGDYKTVGDCTCDTFEPVRCHTFISESTFGIPIFRWKKDDDIFADMNSWWRSNQERGRVSIVYAYALGKAQRVLAGLDPSIGPIQVHGAVERFIEPYATEGIALPPVERAGKDNAKAARGRAMIIAPPSAANSPWLKKFGPASQAFASGWMAIRGARRRRALDRGFILSDHADWNGLLEAIEATGAERVGVTHGYTHALVKYLREEKSTDAFIVPTRYRGEGADDDDAEEAALEQALEGPTPGELPEHSGH
ncbi:MAG: ligase-associated DNA damage response exonuclease [Candidatus Sumerlaeaceae bacterium]